MSKFNLIRTALFVPGNRPERIDKAVNSSADVIIIDLEDAVPLSEKEKARPVVRKKILQHSGKNIIVRVNSAGSGFLKQDLNEVVVKGLACIMLPKVESLEDIKKINDLLFDIENKKNIKQDTIALMPLIETAQGIQNVYKILSGKTDSNRIYTAAFGAADYTLDMGIAMTKNADELFYARSRIAVACRAAGRQPPLDSPYMIDLKDVNGLQDDASRAKQLGFQGKLCVHPSQIDPCNVIFSPRDEEIKFAQRVIKKFQAAEAKGLGVIELGGKLVDYPIVERAKRILKIVENINHK